MRNHLLFLLLLLFPVGLFSQQSYKQDSIGLIKDFDSDSIHQETAVVLFSKGSGKYAFDEWQSAYDGIYSIQDKYENLNGYNVPCKLIPPGRTDKVAFSVKVVKGDIDPSKIVFRSGTGTEYLAKDGAISITGGKEDDAQDVFALYPDDKGKYLTIGKLKVLSYRELDLNLKLVPVKGNTTDAKAVESYLNSDAVYGGLGIRWTVTQDENFDYPTADLESDGSDFFSRYTDGMKALNSAYKSERGTDKQTVYLFVLNSGNLQGKNIAGDMPRGSQFGYIFQSGQSAGSINRTIAHELGHGRFRLIHTFDGEYGGNAQGTEGKTDNLLDYGSGTHLAKWQWDLLFDPGLMVNPFEGDEEGMSEVISDDKLYACLEEIRQSILYGTEIQNRTYPTLSKSEITVGGHKYQFITVKRMLSTEKSFSIKGLQPEFFTERNIWNTEQYCIGYMNKTITIVLSSKEDRDLLAAYLAGTRSNSFLLFVSGYDYIDEIKEFINKNENKTESQTWLDDMFGFVRKTPVAYDSKEYWGSSFVDAMVTRLQPKKITYMAGHDDIGTSNHKMIGPFLGSMVNYYQVRYDVLNPCFHMPLCFTLATTPNVSGFDQRRNNGKQRGVDYVNMLKAECVKGADGLVHDTVDVVCHSMGFAHALGIIDDIREAMKTDLKGLKFGRFYIFAPENACSGEVNVNEWEQVWQYGSDEANDAVWLQDGVAPQCPVKGFDNSQRAYIPSSANRGFLNSHSISNYEWIFEKQKGEKGYVTPRK